LSDDQPYGESSVQAQQGYQEMSNAYAEPEQKKKEYPAEEHGLRAAAEDLAATRAPSQEEPTPRNYVEYGGDRHGESVPANETISLERASDDLTRQRTAEQAAQQPHDPAQLATVVDNIREAFPNRELPPTFVQDLQEAHAQAQQPEAPSEFNDKARAHMAAEEPQPQQPGIDPEIQQALANPKVRAALEAEVQAAESARQQFAQQARAAAQISAAAMFSQWPELASLTTEQLPHALAAIQKVDPSKATAIQAQLSRTQQLWQASRQAEAQRAATQQQQLDAWTKAEDAKFEKEVFAKETPETRQKLQAALPEIIEKDYGISRDDFAFAVKNTPVLRSVAFQKILLDASKYRLAQREVVNKIDRSTPPVQRPGVASPHRGNDSGVDAALRQFRSEASVDNAVKLLMARRNSR
jgi:hypothetical protein